MPTIRLLGAAAVCSVALATPALAQAVVCEPGYCAFYYPYANCQNNGPGNPYTDPHYSHGPNAQAWSSGETAGVAPRRSRAHRSDPSATRMQ